jgi:superfamily II DNA helicase RecQ
MPYQFFAVPVLDSETLAAELNKFLSSNKVIEVDKQLVESGAMSYWSFCVKYLEGDAPNKRNLKYPEKVDYREVLSAEEFKKFSAFRIIRKQIATDEALPAFAIFTDAELAAMATAEKLTKESLLEIKGIGEKKVTKYGLKFVDI